MQIFVENQRVTCTKITEGYKIDPYFNRKELEDLLFQSFFEGLTVKLWEGTRKGAGARVIIMSITPWADINMKAPKNDMTGLNFTVRYLDRRLPRRAGLGW